MDATAKPEADAPRRKRRWPKVVAALVTVVVALIVALPFFLSSGSGRDWLLRQANATLNPGRLAVDRFSFSWFRPTRMSGFTILDPQGDEVVSAPRAVWERNLFQILFRRPRLGTLVLEEATVDVERAGDGSIDVVEALKPILEGTPGTEFKLVIDGGSIRVRSPELADPIQAERFDLVIDRPPAPGVLSWSAVLADDGRNLRIKGSYARWDGHALGQSDLKLDLVPNLWPFAVQARGQRIDSITTGTIHAERIDGRWTTRGDARSQLPGMAPAGSPALSFDGRWLLAQSELGWDIQTLVASLPFATITASGPVPASKGKAGQIAGTVDLPALVRAFPDTFRLRDGAAIDKGKAVVLVTSSEEETGRVWTASASLDQIEAHLGETPLRLREPATLAVRVTEANGTVQVDSAVIESAFLNAEGRGDLDSGITIAGTIDLAGLAQQVGDFVDLGSLEVSGSGDLRAEVKRKDGAITATASASLPEATIGPKGDALAISGFNLGVVVGGDSRWDATIGIDTAKRAGLSVAGATMAVHQLESGTIVIDPIEAVLNGGKLRILAEYDLGATPMLRLKPGTELIDAEVNEEASRRVLSYVAPVLGGGTKATGRVSATITSAEFPLGKDATAKAHVEGNVVFKDLEFTPGEVGADLLRLVGRSDPVLRLDQPVVLSIEEGRVRQTGLSIPVGNLARIEISGDVGFDRSLDLRAEIPFSAGLFPNNPVLSNIVAGTRITVPITGTLNNPKVDQEAFRAELANAGQNAAVRAGAGLLFKALTKPRDPNAPPPLTPAERKAKRIERRMEKRGVL